MIKNCLFACVLCLCRGLLLAQNTDSASLKTKFFGLPLVFYTPDTRWGFGASGIVTWGTARFRSSTTFSLAYTQNRQWLLWFPFQIFPGKRQLAAGKLWQIYGEVGWYRYVYQFFGTGNRALDDFLEKYTAVFPRIRASALKGLAPGQFAGLRWAFDDYRIVQRDSAGLLIAGTLTGAAGGRVSGCGLVWVTDTRDSRFYPRKGVFFEALVYGEGPVTGSDFRYARLSADWAGYFSIGKKSVLAANLVGMSTLGQAPFFQLAQLGGTKRLRGYADGRFRDRHLWLAQGEWRGELFGPFGAVAFGGIGGVGGTTGETTQVRWNAGAGLRFQLDRKQHINVRLDYGLGRKSSGFYLTVGEAF